MAFAAIAFIAPNYRDNKNEWLKAYEPGTTTPKAMALDSGGVTQVAKLQLNADGFLVSAGDALVIPYIDGAYDAYLFPTEAEADANNTTNAERIADNITGAAIAGAGSSSVNELTVLAMTSNTNKEYSVGDVIDTKEFSAGGGGGGKYDTVLTSGVSPNTFDIIISVSDPLISFVLRVEDSTVLLSQLGAVISSDNTAIAQYSYDTYDVTIHDNLYPASNIVITKDNTILRSNDGVSGLVNNDTETTMLGINANYVTLDSNVFDGNSGKVHTQGMVRLYQEKSNFTATNNKFQNIVGNLANNPIGIKQYALSADTFGCTDMDIQNNTFENIIGYDADDAQAGVGFAGGMYISSDESGKNETDNTNPSSGLISNNRFIDIATAGVDGDISHSDAEGIRIFQTQLVSPAFVTFDLKMDNNYFRSIQKSAIKSGGAGGLKISNTTIISDNSADPDASGLPMLAAMRLQEGSDSTVTDTTIKGDFVHGIVVFCANTNIDGLFHESGEIQNSAIYIFALDYTSPFIHDINISNLRLRKANVIVNTFLNAGATSNVAFRDISVSDVICDRMGALDTTNFRFNNVDGVTIRDIHTADPLFNTEVCYLFRDSTNVKINNIYGETTDVAIDESETTNVIRASDYRLNDIEFFASDGRASKTTRLINLRNSTNATRKEIEHLEINNLIISTPEMDGTGNHDILLAESPNFKLNDFSVTVRDTGGGNRPQSGANLLNTKNGSIISNISIAELGTPTGDKYAIQLSGGDKTQIRGVTSKGRGVNLILGDNINVADVTTTGTALVTTATNLTQSNIVNWV